MGQVLVGGQTHDRDESLSSDAVEVGLPDLGPQVVRADQLDDVAAVPCKLGRPRQVLIPDLFWPAVAAVVQEQVHTALVDRQDRKSTRLNSSHGSISYAVFCLKKKMLFSVCTAFSSETSDISS